MSKLKILFLRATNIEFLEILSGFSFNSLFYLRYFCALSMTGDLRIVFLFGCDPGMLWAVCASAVNTFSADWSFTPSTTLSQSYDSNFRFTRADCILAGDTGVYRTCCNDLKVVDFRTDPR
jgi:hypothetical protein